MNVTAFNHSFILQISSPEHNFSPALTPLWFTEAKYEISFFFSTEHILIDSSTNEKSFTVNRAAACFWQRRCLSLRRECVQMALKADLMLGLRHQSHNSGAVSLRNSSHHFRCKNLYLFVGFIFTWRVRTCCACEWNTEIPLKAHLFLH